MSETASDVGEMDMTVDQVWSAELDAICSRKYTYRFFFFFLMCTPFRKGLLGRT